MLWFSLKSFSDAEYGDDESRSRSTSGAAVTINESPITWFSRRQNLVRISTANEDCIEMAEAMRISTSVVDSITKIAVIKDDHLPFSDDNEQAVMIIISLIETKNRKTMRLRHHYLKLAIQMAVAVVHHIPAEFSKSNVVTKAPAGVAFDHDPKMLSLTLAESP